MKNCLENHQNHVIEVISIQKVLSDINESHLQSTIKIIQSSKFYQDKESMKILLKNIGSFFKFRRKQISAFFQLINNLLPKINETFNKEEIMSLFKRKEIHLKLLKDKIISIEDIAIFYGIKNLNLAFFYPEIQVLSSQYPTYIQELKQMQKYQSIIYQFTKENINIDNDPRLQIGNTDNLSVSIQKDDIEKFQLILSQNNINIRNHKIKLSYSESNKCLKNHEIYLLEYAAYYSSLNIFKFLLLNDANFSKFLFKYAICGGNSEIIHLAEVTIAHSGIKQDMREVLSLSIIFHRYEISEYLIESHNIKIENKDFLMSIYYNNYDFFTNHILEFESEYNNLLELCKNYYSSDIENYKLKEMKNKANEQVMLSAGNVDIFFLKVLSNYKGIDFNQSGDGNDSDDKLSMTSPLTYAIQSFNNENAKFLLSLNSINPDSKLLNNTTPFLLACYAGNLEIVKYLIDNFYFNDDTEKVSIDIFRIVDKSGENALHLATRESHLDVVKYLVSLNVFNLNMKSAQGETPLMIAARLGYKDIFDFLKNEEIKKGMDVDNDLKCNDQQFLPLRHIKPLAMGFMIFDNLKEPISLCLLI